jgi:GAF domain-containing protein
MVPAFRKQVLGWSLVVLGLLFFLVSNGWVPFGWAEVWPLFPILLGAFLLRLNRSGGGVGGLFMGLTFLLLGIFFLLFTTHLVDWSQLRQLWPTFLAIAGAGLLAVSMTDSAPTGTMAVGGLLLAVAVLGYLAAVGKVGARVTAPLVRLWPLLLVGIGVKVLREARRLAAKPEPAAPEVEATAAPPPSGGPPEPAEVPSPPTSPERGADSADGYAGAAPTAGDIRPEVADLLASLERIDDREEAIRLTVRELAARFPKFAWVGVYLLEEEETLTLQPDHYVGMDPEHKRIRVPEGICGWAAERRETIVVPDVRQSDRYLACSPFVRSEIVVPVLSGERLWGVLDIDSNELDAFDDRDRRDLEAVAAALAACFERSESKGVKEC